MVLAMWSDEKRDSMNRQLRSFYVCIDCSDRHDTSMSLEAIGTCLVIPLHGLFETIHV